MQTTIGRPADSAGALYFKTDVSPEDLFVAIGRLRKEAMDEIERLVRFLDKTDDYVSHELEEDNELEEIGDTEPSLGSFDRVTDQTTSWRQGGPSDVPEVDAEHETADAAPSLGSYTGWGGDLHPRSAEAHHGGQRICSARRASGPEKCLTSRDENGQ